MHYCFFENFSYTCKKNIHEMILLTFKEDPAPTLILIGMILLPIIVFGFFHLKNNDFFEKFKRNKK
jgi:hypothetical protein